MQKRIRILLVLLALLIPYSANAQTARHTLSTTQMLALDAVNDLISHFWTGSNTSGHIVPTWNGYTFENFGNFTMTAGQTMSYGDMTLLMQGDGNLVLYTQYGLPDQTFVYAANPVSPCYNGSSGTGLCRAVFQPDGNLVLYSGSNVAYWSTGTSSRNGANYRVRISDYYPYIGIVDGNKWIWQGALPAGTPQNAVRPSTGAAWERAIMYMALHNANIIFGTSEPKFKNMVLADWQNLKSTFTIAQLSQCESFNDSSLNQGTDDAGVNSLYYLNIYKDSSDPDALTAAKQTIRNAVARWGAGTQASEGMWMGDMPAGAVGVKSTISALLALAAVEIFQLNPSSPDAQEFITYGNNIYNWLHDYSFTPPGGPTETLLRADGLYYNGVGYNLPNNVPDGTISGYGDTDVVEGNGATYMAGNLAMALLHSKYYAITGNPMYEARAMTTDLGIVDEYGASGTFIHDVDPWADGLLMFEWANDIRALAAQDSRVDNLVNQLAPIARNTNSVIYDHDRTIDGYYGPFWDGNTAPTAIWTFDYLNASAYQLHTSSSSVGALLAGSLF